jgi:hypothetical protein
MDIVYTLFEYSKVNATQMGIRWKYIALTDDNERRVDGFADATLPTEGDVNNYTTKGFIISLSDASAEHDSSGNDH